MEVLQPFDADNIIWSTHPTKNKVPFYIGDGVRAVLVWIREEEEIIFAAN